MTKYKNIASFKIISVFVFFLTTALLGVETSLPDPESLIVGEGNVAFGANEKLVFEKPKNFSKKNFLWQMLYETDIYKPVSRNMLKIYANTIRELCIANSWLLDQDMFGQTPQVFAMYNCHYRIGAILDSLVQMKMGIGSYIPRSSKEKAKVAKWAKGYVKILAPKIIEFDKKFSESTANIEFKQIAFDGKSFDWKVDGFSSLGYRKYNGYVYAAGSKHKFGRDFIAGFSIRYNKKELIIDTVRVEKEFRQQGIGEAILGIIIELAKTLSKDTLFRVKGHAAPDKKEMLPVLMNYYKKFGAIPDFEENNKHTISIKNGKILSGYELKKLEV